MCVYNVCEVSRRFAYSDIRIFGYSHVRIFGYSHIRIFAYSKSMYQWTGIISYSE